MFNDWFRSKYKTVKIPSRDTVFDYWLDTRTNKFESWKNSPAFKTVEFDSEVRPWAPADGACIAPRICRMCFIIQHARCVQVMNMAHVMVPTSETASVSFWLDTLIKKGFNVMLAGYTGTGKTALINGMLGTLPPDNHTSATVNMNFYTSAQSLVTSFESRLQKRTGSTYGPGT